MEPTVDGISVGFGTVNRGKKSVAIDLKTEEGRAVFFELVREADVLFEQFRPGVVDRLGIGPEAASEYNPDLVYWSLTGYGQDGPYRDRVGHDLNYVGLAGLLDMTRPDEQSRPTIPGLPVADLVGGLYAALGIVSSLAAGDHEDGGRYLDIAMADAVLALSQAVVAGALVGENPQSGATPLTGQYPWYNIYATEDGRFVTLAANEPKFWQEFCDVINRDDLREYHGTDDAAELRALREELEDLFRTRTQAAWEELLADEDVMVGPVRTPREAYDDEHFRTRGMVLEGTYPRVDVPIRTSGLTGATETPPRKGEQTNEVLRQHGIDPDRIASLREGGIVE
jgi:crotonobetainyl-CoA:carnitine CoA-transferase CaiB-like acyl-CoA transferase